MTVEVAAQAPVLLRGEVGETAASAAASEPRDTMDESSVIANCITSEARVQGSPGSRSRGR